MSKTGHGRRLTGHIFPRPGGGRKMRDRGWRVVWMSNPGHGGPAYARGFEMVWVRFGALRRKGLLQKLLLPFNLLRASGGLQNPPGAARRRSGHGRLHHLSRRHDGRAPGQAPGGALSSRNSVAGLANRVLAGVADRVLSGFPDVLAKAAWVEQPGAAGDRRPGGPRRTA